MSGGFYEAIILEETHFREIGKIVGVSLSDENKLVLQKACNVYFTDKTISLSKRNRTKKKLADMKKYSALLQTDSKAEIRATRNDHRFNGNFIAETGCVRHVEPVFVIPNNAAIEAATTQSPWGIPCCRAIRLYWFWVPVGFGSIAISPNPVYYGVTLTL